LDEEKRKLKRNEESLLELWFQGGFENAKDVKILFKETIAQNSQT
jgi:hypothetical protein